MHEDFHHVVCPSYSTLVQYQSVTVPDTLRSRLADRGITRENTAGERSGQVPTIQVFRHNDYAHVNVLECDSYSL